MEPKIVRVGRPRMASHRCRPAAVVASAAAALLTSSSASAHVGTGLPGGILSGFIHPLKGADHLLAMVLVGVWGAFLGPPLIHLLPMVFPAMMVVGAIVGMLGLPSLPVEAGIALSVLVLGSCIALSIRAPVWAASLVVAVFAAFHGYAHGRELPSAADPIAYSAGFVLATGLLHVAGIGIGLLNRRPRGLLVTRSFGGVSAALGVWLLYRAIGA